MLSLPTKVPHPRLRLLLAHLPARRAPLLRLPALRSPLRRPSASTNLLAWLPPLRPLRVALAATVPSPVLPAAPFLALPALRLRPCATSGGRRCGGRGVGRRWPGRDSG